MGELAGIDLGGTNIKFGLFSGKGDLLKQWSVSTDLREEGAFLWRQIADEIKNNAEPSELEGIGLGIPGPVLPDGFVESCVNLHLRNFNPAEKMREYFPGMKIRAANDANVAALGEQWKGAGQGHRNLAMVTLGTGVGGSVIQEGKIIYGTNGLGGEFGHVQINAEETEICNCGGKGCLDQAASASGIVRYAGKFLRESSQASVLRGKEIFTAKDVLEAARNQDRIAEKTVEYCMNFLAKVLAMVSYVVDPEVFIIGGGVSNAGDYLIEMIQKLYEPYITLSQKKAKIFRASLGNNAGIYGAARLVLREEDEPPVSEQV